MTWLPRSASWRYLCLLGAGVVLRVAFIHFANPLQGDPQIYGNIARNLLQHGTYSFAAPGAPLTPTLIRLPGYPLFLLGCFSLFGPGNFVAVEVVQMLLDLVACILLARLAGDLHGKSAGWWAFAAAILCPFTANYTATPLTETLTLFTISWSFLALAHALNGLLCNRGAHWRWWLASFPVSLSYSLLLRPEQGLLAAAVLPAVAWAFYLRRRAQGATAGSASSGAMLATAALGLLTLFPLAFWTARNWRTFHTFQPLAPHYANDPGEAVPIGFQRWYRSWAIEFASTEEVYWNYDGSPILLGDLPARAFDTPAQKLQTAQLLTDYNKTVTPTPQLDARFQALADQRQKNHPLQYAVLLPLARLANMLLRPRTELMNTQLAWWRWREAGWQTVFAGAYASLNALYLLGGIAGWTRWWRSSEGVGRLLLLSMTGFAVLRCALLLTLDNSEPRYTLELFPLLIVWIAALAPSNSTKARSEAHL